jgi:hypothetical protein
MPSLEEVSRFLDDAEEQLRLMVSRVEESKVWVRSSDHRDVVLGAHLSRIAASCASVFLLCRLGCGHDASVLCRVLMEHDISMMFLFAQEDPVRSTHDFVFDSLTHMGITHLMAAKHYPHLVTLDESKAQEAIKTGEAVDYRSKFSSQLLFLRRNFDADYLEWYTDLVYGHLSIHTHPQANGMDAFAPDLSQPYKVITPTTPELCATAAVLAFAFSLSAFGWTAQIWGLPWRSTIYNEASRLIEAHPNIGPQLPVGTVLPDFPKQVPRPQKQRTSSKKKNASG